jgi:fido (protein-threonine AMPylation protein)
MPVKVLEWREVTPLEPLNGGIDPMLKTVDTLRSAWEQAIDASAPDRFREARERSLRRHAIETGIIERLYDLDWGVTEALVAEGLTLEAAERHGSISPETLAIIKDQFDALEYLAEVARGARPLSAALIRDLHKIITRHQDTYEATDHLGQPVKARLHHGQYKRWPNHIRRRDGSVLQFTPPEQVEQQIELLLEHHRGSMAEAHPVARAAWLHHRFICIHPFEDGNGRVGRALVLLELLRSKYAPLVVDRRNRNEYLSALDAANEGDPLPLVRLFCKLEIVALRSELERPAEQVPEQGAVRVAKVHVDRVRDLRRTADQQRRRDADWLATQVHQRLRDRLEELARGLEDTFRELDPQIRKWVDAAAPSDPRATWWRHQLIRAAREVDFWTDLSEGSWWVHVKLQVLGQSLRYVAAVQRAGERDVGVRAVTAFAELLPERGDPDLEAEVSHPIPLIQLSPTDSVTMVAGQQVDEVWPEVEALVERTFAVALDRFGRQLG